MGRFDALNNLEDTQAQTPPKTSPSPITNVSQAQPVQTEDGKKSTKPQNRLPTKPPVALNELEKPEKYTTHLEPSLINKLKLHATQRDMKDYQVIKNALLLYFEKNRE